MLAQEGSLLGLVARCAGGERRLAPIDVSGAPSDELSRTVGQIADPERPIETPEFFGDMFGGRRDSKPVSRVVKLAAAATLVLALEIGKASWRERVCQYVSISVVAVYLKKK